MVTLRVVTLAKVGVLGAMAIVDYYALLRLVPLGCTIDERIIVQAVLLTVCTKLCVNKNKEKGITYIAGAGGDQTF